MAPRLKSIGRAITDAMQERDRIEHLEQAIDRSSGDCGRGPAAMFLAIVFGLAIGR